MTAPTVDREPIAVPLQQQPQPNPARVSTQGGPMPSETLNPNADPDPSVAEASKTVPLRRNWRFQLLWNGSMCAAVGYTAADIAYPLAILAMTHSPAQAGVFATLQLVTLIVLGVPVGQLLDKYDRRRMLMLAEGTRAAVAGLVALAWLLGVLTFWQLLGSAVVIGAAQSLGAARTLMIRQVVPTEQLTQAVTQETVRDHGAELVGPPLGGAMFAVSRAFPFLFVAVMYGISFVCAFFVRVPKAAAAQTVEADHAAPSATDSVQSVQSEQSAPPAEDGGMLGGVKTLFGSPILRATVITIALVNMVGISLNLCLIVLMQSQHVSSTATGAVLAAGACGGLLGAAFVKTVHRLLRPGWLLIASCAWFTIALTAAAFPNGPVYAGACMFLASMAIPSAVVMIDVLILRQVADEVRGRTLGALQTIMGLGMPVGMLTGGLMLQYFSATTTVLAAAAGLGVAALYALSQKALRDARWPQASSKEI